MEPQIKQGQIEKGIYVSIVDTCPFCKGASKSILLPDGKPCPVCGGSGIVVGLVKFEDALLSFLLALGLIDEEKIKELREKGTLEKGEEAD